MRSILESRDKDDRDIAMSVTAQGQANRRPIIKKGKNKGTRISKEDGLVGNLNS